MNLTRIVVLLALLAIPKMASAQCQPIDVRTSTGAAVFSAVDISGGAVTTQAFAVNPYAQILLRANLTDANDSVSTIVYLIEESDTFAGTYGPYGVCTVSLGVFTCVKRTISWDHADAAQGNTMRLEWPATGRWWKITATPTGPGAADTLTLTAEGCK